MGQGTAADTAGSGQGTEQPLGLPSSLAPWLEGSPTPSSACSNQVRALQCADLGSNLGSAVY